MPWTEQQWSVLARRMRQAMAQLAPDWTDANAHDPGLTVLELLAYALEELPYRPEGLGEPGRRLARRVAERAAAISARLPDQGDCGPGLQRVSYSHGMVLGADDFRAEQEYVRARLQRLHRLLHGSGIVGGLTVRVEQDAGGARVVIEPGLALDAQGQEIAVEQPASLALPAADPACLVLLRYAERPCRPVPLVSVHTEGPATQATRVVETFDAMLSPVPAADAVAIARLRRTRGRWRVDGAFKPPRLR